MAYTYAIILPTANENVTAENFSLYIFSIDASSHS